MAILLANYKYGLLIKYLVLVVLRWMVLVASSIYINLCECSCVYVRNINVYLTATLVLFKRPCHAFSTPSGGFDPTP